MFSFKKRNKNDVLTKAEEQVVNDIVKQAEYNPVKSLKKYMQEGKDITKEKLVKNAVLVPDAKGFFGLYGDRPLKEPVLLLMKNDGFIDVVEDIKMGELQFTDDDGIEKSFLISPNKIHSLPNGKDKQKNDMYLRVIIAYEDEATPYPVKPKYMAEMLRKILQKISMNYQERDAQLQMAIGKKWLFIIIGGAVALYVLYSTGVLNGLFASAVNATANATPSAVAGGGAILQ